MPEDTFGSPTASTPILQGARKFQKVHSQKTRENKYF